MLRGMAAAALAVTASGVMIGTSNAEDKKADCTAIAAVVGKKDFNARYVYSMYFFG